MSRHRNKKHHKKNDQRKPPVLITHHADRRCIVGLPVTPKKNYRPTAR